MPPINFEIEMQLEELLIVLGMFLHSGNTLSDVDNEVIFKLYDLVSKETTNRGESIPSKETLH